MCRVSEDWKLVVLQAGNVYEAEAPLLASRAEELFPILLSRDARTPRKHLTSTLAKNVVSENYQQSRIN